MCRFNTVSGIRLTVFIYLHSSVEDGLILSFCSFPNMDHFRTGSGGQGSFFSSLEDIADDVRFLYKNLKENSVPRKTSGSSSNKTRFASCCPPLFDFDIYRGWNSYVVAVGRSETVYAGNFVVFCLKLLKSLILGVVELRMVFGHSFCRLQFLRPVYSRGNGHDQEKCKFCNKTGFICCI